MLLKIVISLFMIFSFSFLECQANKDYEEGYNNKYYLGTIKVSYYDALQICQEKNMQLVSIETSRKNNEIFRLLVGNENAHWSSGNRISTNSWVWLKGEPMEFFSWRENEPNNKRTDEKCIEVFRSTAGILLWNDQPCQDERPFICEILKEDVINSNCEIDNGEFVKGSTIANKKYYIGKETVTYSKALQSCRAICMSLINIENYKNNKDIAEALGASKASGTFWTSAHYKPNNVWQWANGANIGYSNWKSGEPNNRRSNEYCIEIETTDTNVVWNDQPCEDKRMYVCENYQKFSYL